MLVAVLMGFALAFGAPIFAWAFKRAAGPILAIFPAFIFAYLLQFVPEAARGRPWRFALPWDLASGLEVSFHADALALYFGLVLTLAAAASLCAIAARDLGEGLRARLLFAVTALFAGALGCVFADQPILLVTFAAAMSLAAFLALTADSVAARLGSLWILLAWLLSDLLLLVLLARLFVDVQGGLLGAGGIAGLVANGRLEPAFLVAILALKLAPLFTGLADRNMAPTGPALAAIAGLVLPAMLAVLLRFSGILPEVGRALLLAAAGFGLFAGGAVGLGARRALSVLAGLTLVVFSAAAFQVARATDGAHAAALLIATTGALGLCALYLLIPHTFDLNLKSLRAQLVETPLGASLAILGLVILAGLVPSTGLLAFVASANGVAAGDAMLAAAVTIGGFGILLAVGARIGAVLAIGEAGEARPPARTIPVACASSLLLAAIVVGCAPQLLAQLLIGPAVRPGYVPSLLLPSLQAWWPIAGALALGALLFWQRLLFARFLKVLGKLAPARRHLPEVIRARFSRAADLPRLPILAGALTAACALAAVVAAGLAWPSAGFVIKPLGIAASALVAGAIIGGTVAIPQRRFASAVPVVAIAGALTIASVLALGAVELGFVMLLLLIIQTIVLLMVSARETPHASSSARLALSARIALALIAGTGAAIAALDAGQPPAHAVSEPSGVTGLVGASGLALREAGLTAIQRWSGVILVLLILGVAIADLSPRRRGEA